MTKAPERIWIEHGEECPYFYEKDELHEVGSAVTEYVRYSDYAALEAKLAEKEAEKERLKEDATSWSMEASRYAKALDKAREREAEALSRTGALKVKPLDENDYEEIISAAAINMKKAASGARGQIITVQDSFDWWVMKETEHRILSALPRSPAGVTEAMLEALKRIRDTAMEHTLTARIPECGVFGGIAQDADWLLNEITAVMEAVHDDDLEAAVVKLREALEPFAEVAECDIGDDESDSDTYHPIDARNSGSGNISIGHLRRALETMKETDWVADKIPAQKDHSHD